MKRALALLGSAVFLVIAPGTLAVYVPWTFTGWRLAPSLLGFFPLRVVGGLMIAAGLPVLLDSFARYVAVSALIFGQGLLFGSVSLLEYGLVVWLGFFAFVVLYEEPTLRGKFGKEYEDYCARVPRWLPRLGL